LSKLKDFRLHGVSGYSQQIPTPGIDSNVA